MHSAMYKNVNKQSFSSKKTFKHSTHYISITSLSKGCCIAFGQPMKYIIEMHEARQEVFDRTPACQDCDGETKMRNLVRCRNFVIAVTLLIRGQKLAREIS